MQRENILFGQAFDEERYWRAVELACLLPDLQLLPDGDMTEVTRRGCARRRTTDWLVTRRLVRGGST